MLSEVTRRRFLEAGAAAVAVLGGSAVAGVSGVAVSALGGVAFLLSGSMMEFPFSSSFAVTVIRVERSAPTATTLTSRKVDFVTW